MDLLRVCVALVGVALLIIALVALAFYLDVRGRMAAPQAPFSAFCYGGMWWCLPTWICVM